MLRRASHRSYSVTISALNRFIFVGRIVMEKNKVADVIGEVELAPQNTPAEKPGFYTKLKKECKNFFTYNLPGKAPRVWELDLIRGIIMIFVSIDHIARFSHYWGIVQFQTAFGKALENFAVSYFESDISDNVYPLALWFLCFMSGISSQFTRSRLSRLLKFWGFCALFMGVYLALHFIFPEQITGYIVFNIVAVLTLSVTVWFVFDKLNVPDFVRLIFGVIFIITGITFFLVYRLGGRTFFIENDFLALLLYNEHGYKLSPNNFEPLIPHLGFFILGGVCGKYYYKDKTSRLRRKTPPKWLNPLMILGKHSLVAYLFLPTVGILLLLLTVKFVGLFL